MAVLVIASQPNLSYPNFASDNLTLAIGGHLVLSRCGQSTAHEVFLYSILYRCNNVAFKSVFYLGVWQKCSKKFSFIYLVYLLFSNLIILPTK
jgi:hypothetical protein